MITSGLPKDLAPTLTCPHPVTHPLSLPAQAGSTQTPPAGRSPCSWWLLPLCQGSCHFSVSSPEGPPGHSVSAAPATLSCHSLVIPRVAQNVVRDLLRPGLLAESLLPPG